MANPFPTSPLAADHAPWAPPAGVTHHDGSPLPPDADFFTPPPPEIGPVITAATTLRQPGLPRSLAARLGMALLGLGVCLGFGAAVAAMTPHPDDRIIPLAAAGGVGLVTGLAVLWVTRFCHRCSYVGALGLVEYSVTRSRTRAPRRRLFLFATARDLRTKQVSQYINGVYAGTNFSFIWTDEAGRKVFAFKGSHYAGTKRRPRRHNPYHFAQSAEAAWSQHLLQRLAPQLEDPGYLEFPVNKKDRILIGPGYLEFHFGGRTERMTPEDIKDFRIGEGVFHIAHKDARWFSRQGKFTFQYGQLANAHFFLLCLEKLLGLRF